MVKNIKKIKARADEKSITLRPHFKTHQSASIGQWFRELGIEKIAVSSFDMARYFADNGWSDISICIPLNPLLIPDINQLAKEVSLHVLVDSLAAVELLKAEISTNLNVWIEVDIGDARTGIDANNKEEIVKVAEEIELSERLKFKGILNHAGIAYKAESTQEIEKIYKRSMKMLNSIKQYLLINDISQCLISIGDTPTSSIIDSYDERVDEMRPGNFVFYDLTQFNLGSCNEDEIALAIACPVISTHPERDEVIVHGGAIHLSKEYYNDDYGDQVFGLIALPDEGKGWTKHIKDMAVRKISQEHGIIHGPRNEIEKIKIGDVLVILPVHSCLNANLFSELYTTDGKRIQTFRI